MVLELKYHKNVVFKGKIYSHNIGNICNFYIDNGKIELDEYIQLPKLAKIVVRDQAHIKFGRNCYINHNFVCVAHKSIEIGDNVSIGPNCCIFDHDHYFQNNGQEHGKYKTGEVKIEDNVWIGAGVIILRNTIIGKNAIIGAGTLVKGIIPPNSIVTNEKRIKIRNLSIDNEMK